MPLPNAPKNLPPKIILFATDFSPASGVALRYAAALAAAYHSTLIVAHAIPEPQEAVTGHRISDRDKQFRADAERKMDLLKDFELLTHVRHREVVVEGRPDEALAYLAETERADVLVLGTHGRTGVMDLLLGSVGGHLSQGEMPGDHRGAESSFSARRSGANRTCVVRD